MEGLIFCTNSGPCLDHVCPSFISRPARALKCSKLIQNSLIQNSMECLFFILPGSCLDKFSDKIRTVLTISGIISQSVTLTFCFSGLVFFKSQGS